MMKRPRWFKGFRRDGVNNAFYLPDGEDQDLYTTSVILEYFVPSGWYLSFYAGPEGRDYIGGMGGTPKELYIAMITWKLTGELPEKARN